MEDYKVKYQLLGSNEDQVTEWMDNKKALKEFEKLKAGGKCIWAELLYCNWEDDAEDTGSVVVAEFTNRVIEIMGIKMLVPAV